MAKHPTTTTSPEEADIGVRIRTRAAFLGITVSAVADRAGMHRQHLNSISRGYKGRSPSNPTKETKAKLALALEVPVEYFDMACCRFCGSDWRKLATMPADEIDAVGEQKAA